MYGNLTDCGFAINSMPLGCYNSVHCSTPASACLIPEAVELARGRVAFGVRREACLQLAAVRHRADRLDNAVAHHAQGVRQAPFPKSQEATFGHARDTTRHNTVAKKATQPPNPTRPDPRKK